jgi:hypothetical protein
MNFQRTSIAAVLLLTVGSVVSCSTYPTLKALPIDCTVESGYEFKMIDPFETIDGTPFWTSNDGTLGVTQSAKVEAMTDGTRCGSADAAVLRSFHANDWGSLFGYSNFGPRDGSMYDGISFWARAPGNTTKAFTILFDDPNTNNPDKTPDAGSAGNCTDYSSDAGTTGPTTTIVDPATGMAISGTSTAAPPPNACGNGYSVIAVVTTDWRFYKIPFVRFQQGATPNRVPNVALPQVGTVKGTGLLTSKLMLMTVRMPKEATMDLWLDDLSFYRAKGIGVDAGVTSDAADR